MIGLPRLGCSSCRRDGIILDMSLKILISLSILLTRMPVAPRQQQSDQFLIAATENSSGLVPSLAPLSAPFDKGKLIVVQGIVNSAKRVNVLIDTGATRSIISPRLAKVLQLRTLRKKVEFIAGDRTLRTRLVHLPSLELGPIRRPLACLVADLPLPELELLIGWDMLSDIAFTVDFENRFLNWAPEEALEYRIPFDASHKQIIVPLKLGTREIPVLLDSGADTLYLFGKEVGSWLNTLPDEPQRRIGHLSYERRGSKIRLSRVDLGGEIFERMRAVILEPDLSPESHVHNWQGLMGMSVLNAKRARFDFPNGLFSWDR